MTYVPDQCSSCGGFGGRGHVCPTKKPPKTVEDYVTDYWVEHYATEHCTLCGNSGVIDTTGVRTPAGLAVGRKQPCICPNGQSVRERGGVVGVVYEIAPSADGGE